MQIAAFSLPKPQFPAIKSGPVTLRQQRPALTTKRIGGALMAAQRLCSIEGCGKRLCSREYCKAHYARFVRNGGPLGGVNRLEGVEWLKAHVTHSGDKCLIWPFGKDGHGYGRVTHPFTRRANRLMCLLAHGEPPVDFPDAAHRCGNPSCVNPGHLRWASISENMMDRVDHGTANRGEAHGMATLSTDQVLEIKGAKGAASSSVVAGRYGINPSTVQKIWRGERWGWL